MLVVSCAIAIWTCLQGFSVFLISHGVLDGAFGAGFGGLLGFILPNPKYFGRVKMALAGSGIGACLGLAIAARARGLI